MKKILIPLLILGAVGLAIGIYQYNKPHKDIRSAEPAFTLEATELYSAYDTEEAAANEKYLDKVIQVTGEVADVSENGEGNLTVTLDGGGMLGGVICEMDTFSEEGTEARFEPGQTVTLKGICTGMLMDVVLVRCVPVS